MPFYRGSLEARVHNSGAGHGSCRFMVSVDPTGEDHVFRVLERTESFEAVDREMWENHLQRVRDAALADCLTRCLTRRRKVA